MAASDTLLNLEYIYSHMIKDIFEEFISNTHAWKRFTFYSENVYLFSSKDKEI